MIAALYVGAIMPIFVLFVALLRQVFIEHHRQAHRRQLEHGFLLAMGFGREEDDERGIGLRRPMADDLGLSQVWSPTPAQLALEADLLRPTTQLVAEAEAAEEARWVSVYGPDDAPERPPWPVKWCSKGGGHWHPLGTGHGHIDHVYAAAGFSNLSREDLAAYFPQTFVMGPTGPTGAPRGIGPTGSVTVTMVRDQP